MQGDELRAHAAAVGLDLDELAWGKLAELRRLWQHYSPQLDEDTLNTHIVESLQAVALASRLGAIEHWLDVGSGAGFPALVVGACLDLTITCIEPHEKRANLLELVLRKTARGKPRVLRGRIEQGRWKGVGGAAPILADVASARAVFGPERWLVEARPWVRPGGVILVHLGLEDPDVGELVDRVDGPRRSIRGYRRPA